MTIIIFKLDVFICYVSGQRDNVTDWPDVLRFCWPDGGYNILLLGVVFLLLKTLFRIIWHVVNLIHSVMAQFIVVKRKFSSKFGINYNVSRAGKGWMFKSFYSFVSCFSLSFTIHDWRRCITECLYFVM